MQPVIFPLKLLQLSQMAFSFLMPQFIQFVNLYLDGAYILVLEAGWGGDGNKQDEYNVC